MREILFRGKHTHMFSSNKPLDGMWCYGYLVDKNYINDKTDMGDGEYLGEMLVDPETVGQYTGLHDKNGVEIFEGDIVHCISRFDDAKMVVIFEEGEFRMVLLEKIDSYVSGGGFYALRCFEKEVIGNLHDNPELVEAAINRSMI